MAKSVTDLDVYQLAYRLALDLHKVTLDFPSEERYALSSQVRRASKGICANLAEGFAKSYKSQPEFGRFLLMALGSAEEMQVWLDFVRDLGYVDAPLVAQWKTEYQIVCRMLNGLISTVNKPERKQA
jgi:four helix bundle protein